MLPRLIAWGQERTSVRAMLLTSSRTDPNAVVDIFSDYDIILAVKDIHPFFENRDWLEDFGQVLLVYRDPIELEHGHERFRYITQYEHGMKIDFTLWPVQLLKTIACSSPLPDELDGGYMVLLDKDYIAANLQLPRYHAHIPVRPSEAIYLQVIEEFLHEATYVAKHLWRGELMPAKYDLDHAMKQIHVRKMLEWRIEIDHNWSAKPGAYGRGLQRHLSPDVWAEFQATYVGAETEENWQALFGTLSLFQKVATEVGRGLGYEYPNDQHQRALAYLQRVKSLDRKAQSFE